MDAAQALLPYISKRAPQAVEISGPEGAPIDMRETHIVRSKLAGMLGVEE
jgi:hypothetical protein